MIGMEFFGGRLRNRELRAFLLQRNITEKVREATTAGKENGKGEKGHFVGRGPVSTGLVWPKANLSIPRAAMFQSF